MKEGERHWVQEMNELVRTVADYIGLYFRTGFTGEEDFAIELMVKPSQPCHS